MALSSNPTKTRNIENAYRRESKKRHKIFNQSMIAGVIASQTSSIRNDNDFAISDNELNRLMAYMRVKAYQDIIGVSEINNANSSVQLSQTDRWWAIYINSSYIRGIETAQQQLAFDGVRFGELSLKELRDLYQVGTDEEVARLLASTNTLHAQTSLSIQRLSLTSMIQATETMLGQINRQIDFARTQVNVKTSDIIRDLTKRISVASSTGEQIASTSTIQAFQNAQINNAVIASEKTGEEIQVRWLTRMDNIVRHLHANWHGQVMTPIEASQNINESPYNCRCGFAQVSPESNTEKRQEMFDKERDQLLSMI